MKPKAYLLDVPIEILLRILDYLYINQDVLVQRRVQVRADEIARFQMNRVPMSAQLIRTCKQLHRDTQKLLYANNTFNCSYREGLKLLLQGIGSKNFVLVRHVVIDWEQLQDFAWSLAKEDYNLAMSGLEVVDLANWRMRVQGGSSSLLREVKSFERQLCQSAMEICEKHPKLKIVAQRVFQRPGRIGNSHRVKWRFITSEAELKSDETIVPIEEELAQLKASGDSEAGGLGAQQMIDPF